ncbi:MAG TPA: PHB depolymerase family esterase [Thermoanaerobaculia bacterium]|nr:PHB depolymerase family esterase [Thermoanaerobaculia bacterium]
MIRPIAVALSLLVSAHLFAAKVEKRTLTSRGKERTYSIFVPDGVDTAKPMPLLITLHGSGRNGASLVDKWKPLAAKSGIIVAGPDSINSAEWSAPEDGPQLLFDLVETLKKEYPIDGRRVYLFGHSGGACFALQMGLLESEYFAAVAIHAGSLHPSIYTLPSRASRKIPFSLFVGTKDPYFPVADVRATRDALVAGGCPAELTEIPNHNHDYYSRSVMINEQAWAFLEKHALAADAKFTRYANT